MAQGKMIQILRRFVPPYKGQMALNIFFNMLSTVLSLFSFAAIIPVLRILFGLTATDVQRVDLTQVSGLQETVAQLIGGNEIEVSTSNFQNDFERFRTKDDVLTLLVHLGYLTYDPARKTVHVPNEEVRDEFRRFLCNDQVGEHWRKLLDRSRKL